MQFKSRIEVLCGSGYEWQKYVNGEIPIGAVPISLNHSKPVFVARVSIDGSFIIGAAYMNGTAKLSFGNHDYDDDDDEDNYKEFDILVGKNVKHRKNRSINRTLNRINQVNSSVHRQWGPY